MGRVVIVGMKPKSGCTDALKTLVDDHVPRLSAEGLVTSRAPIILEAADGTIIEVFEWASAAAIEAAHSNPAVQAMWGEFAQVCEFVPVGALPEAGELFSEFSPLN